MAFAALSFGCDRPQGNQERPVHSGRQVKIGLIGPFSGGEEAKGESVLKGVNIFLDSHPLLKNGDEVILVTDDDGNNPVQTLAAFENMVENQKVSAVIIFSTSGPVLEINRIADRYKTPVLALLASHPDITLGSCYLSQLCMDNRFQGMVAALFVRDELFLSKAAIFEDINSDHSLSLATAFREQFLEVGGTIIDMIPVSIKPGDLEAKLTTLRAQKTECLYFPVDAGQFIRISKALASLNWHPVRMGSDGLFATASADYPNDLGLLENTMGIEFYSPHAKWVTFGRRLLKRELDTASGEWNSYAMAGAEGIALIYNALYHSINPFDRDEINRRIRGIRNFKGFMGNISIQPDGKASRPLIINTIKEGKPRFHLRVH